MDQVSVSGSIWVAAVAFAPGYLGELTQVVSFEIIDDVLENARRVQAQVWVLPPRVAIYLLLASALFANLGYTQV